MALSDKFSSVQVQQLDVILGLDLSRDKLLQYPATNLLHDHNNELWQCSSMCSELLCQEPQYFVMHSEPTRTNSVSRSVPSGQGVVTFD
jgi:hypothetical protein